MKFIDIILRAKRLATPMKVLGIGFLAYHCATADVRFNPLWIGVYVAVALVVSNACVGFHFVANKIRPPKTDTHDIFNAEEIVCVCKMHSQSLRMKKKPWTFLLIAGEDGFFFLPLLYLGITPVSAIAATTFFTLMHYRDKPTYTLPGTFLFCAANVLIVLPHGILPMVIGHFILDATAFGMAPVMKMWIKADQEKHELAQHHPGA